MILFSGGNSTLTPGSQIAECRMQNVGRKRIARASVRSGSLKSIPVSQRLPVIPTTLLRALLLRGAALWLLARLSGSAVIAIARAEGLEVGTSLLPLWTVAAASILVLGDLHRRKELSLLSNLGVSATQAVFVGGLPPVFLEAVLLLLGS